MTREIMKYFHFEMRKLFVILTAVLLTTSAFAQTPQKMSYQAVIRNSSNDLVINTIVGMKISILQDSSSGTVVYTETQTPRTNANGLVSIEIGGGPDFSTINWANNIYFIKTETDPTGETNYTITGISQLISVPYALHAKTAVTADHLTSLSIGDSYQGGIIFWLDDTGQHGLIAATADNSTGATWRNATDLYTGTTGNGLYAGVMNTALIVAIQMADSQSGNFAAKICADYSVTVNSIIYGDWYLPSKFELNLLYLQRDVVGGFASAWYWSSSEFSSTNAFYHFFNISGGSGACLKNATNHVRAIRAF